MIRQLDGSVVRKLDGGDFSLNVRYYYGLQQYSWVNDEWTLPGAVVGAVDLRPLPFQMLPGGPPQGFAFVASRQPVDVPIAYCPHFGSEAVTTGMQDAWETELGYRPQGATVLDLLWDMLTDGADATGSLACKPLIPTTLSQLELHLGGHSMVKRERFEWGVHPHTNRVRDVLRADFEKEWEDSNGDAHCQRSLDFTCKKYRVDDWREFVPTRLHPHVPGRLPHQTTITEDFNTADSDTLGPDLSWTEINGDWDIVTNQAVLQTAFGSAVRMARADSDLSSTDHYSQADAVNAGSGDAAGAAARKDGTATNTHYSTALTFGTNLLKVRKVVAGVDTQIDSDSVTPAGSNTCKCECNGSTIKGYFNASEVSSNTDTAITTGVRCGIFGHWQSGSTKSTVDNFEAADLAAAATPQWIIGAGAGGRVFGLGA